MSYMSLFEKSARNSVAISVLNKLRHWLQGRQPAGLSDEEKNVMEEALEILESPQFEQMVIHSFQGLDNGLNSSVLPISIALKATIRQIEDVDQNVTASLQKLLSSDALPESEIDRNKIVDFLNQAIQVISDSNLNTGSNSFAMSHSRGL
jgi:hypothetical protein